MSVENPIVPHNPIGSYPIGSYLGGVGRNVANLGRSLVGQGPASDADTIPTASLYNNAPPPQSGGVLGYLRGAMPTVRGLIDVGSEIGDAVDAVYGKDVDHNFKDFQIGARIMPALGKGYGLVHENVLAPLFGYQRGPAPAAQAAASPQPAQAAASPQPDAATTPVDVADSDDYYFPPMDAYGKEMNTSGRRPSGESPPPVNPITPPEEAVLEEAVPEEAVPAATPTDALPTLNATSLSEYLEKPIPVRSGRGGNRGREDQERLRKLLQDARVIEHLNKLPELQLKNGNVHWVSGKRTSGRSRGSKIYKSMPLSSFVREMEKIFPAPQFAPTAPTQTPEGQIPSAVANPIIETPPADTGSAMSDPFIRASTLDIPDLADMVESNKESFDEFHADLEAEVPPPAQATPGVLDRMQKFMDEDNLEQLILEAPNTPEGQAILNTIYQTEHGKRLVDRVLTGSGTSGPITADTMPVTGSGTSGPIAADTLLNFKDLSPQELIQAANDKLAAGESPAEVVDKIEKTIVDPELRAQLINHVIDQVSIDDAELRARFPEGSGPPPNPIADPNYIPTEVNDRSIDEAFDNSYYNEDTLDIVRELEEAQPPPASGVSGPVTADTRMIQPIPTDYTSDVESTYVDPEYLSQVRTRVPPENPFIDRDISAEVLPVRMHRLPDINIKDPSSQELTWAIDDKLAAGESPAEVMDEISKTIVDPELRAQLINHAIDQASIDDAELRARFPEGNDYVEPDVAYDNPITHIQNRSIDEAGFDPDTLDILQEIEADLRHREADIILEDPELRGQSDAYRPQLPTGTAVSGPVVANTWDDPTAPVVPHASEVNAASAEELMIYREWAMKMGLRPPTSIEEARAMVHEFNRSQGEIPQMRPAGSGF